MTENLLFIGTVQAPAPIYHRNALKNFTEFKTLVVRILPFVPLPSVRNGGWTDVRPVS